jgi:hypothetical protein
LVTVHRTRHPSHDFRREFMADGSHFVATAELVDWWIPAQESTAKERLLNTPRVLL